MFELTKGYKEGFGADADHLKTTDDIDLMVAAGFTMFTIDPGEHVVNEADYPSELSVDETESVTSPFEHFLVAMSSKDLESPW